MQIMKKVLSAIRNSNADNEKSTSAIRNSLKKHDTLYSVADTAAVNAADIAVAESPLRTYLCDK